MSHARILLKDIQSDAIAGPYPDFWRKYFASITPRNASHDGVAVSFEAVNSSAFQAHPYLSNIEEWLNSIYAANGNTTRTWSTLPTTMKIVEECPGSSLVLEPTNNCGWDKTLMIGFAVADSLFSYALSLSQLYTLARQVFFAQPLRYSLHGVLIHGDVVEIWVFDRSGMYCSEPLSLEADHTRLASIMSVYANKTEEELGVKPFLSQDEIGLYRDIQIQGQTKRLYLQEEAFVDREEFFGTNMMCHRAKFYDDQDWTHVVKFKWRDYYHEPEQDTFDIIQQKNISGVVSLVYHIQIEEVVNLRARIRHKPCKNLFLEAQTDDPNIKGLRRYTTESKSYFTNRFLTCLVFSPLGKPLHTWKNSLELLTVLRDTIRAHRLLLQDAHILHRDISSGNIIIVDSPPHGSKGILIDLDRAMHLVKEQPVAGNIAGTRMFTAIGLLNLDAQTYRHDLESFFYLFLWLVFCQGEENLPHGNLVIPWGQDSRQGSAEAKLNDMKEHGFKLILDQFAPKYEPLKDLAWKLRDAIFQPNQDELWLGTDMSEQGTNSLYDAVLDCFQQAIDKLQAT